MAKYRPFCDVRHGARLKELTNGFSLKSFNTDRSRDQKQIPLVNRLTLLKRRIASVYNPAAASGVQAPLAVDSHVEYPEGWISGTQRRQWSLPALHSLQWTHCQLLEKPCWATGGTTYCSVVSGGRHAWSGYSSFGPREGYVDLDGERLAVRAGVTTIVGYSAHADQEGLVKFVTSMRRRLSHIRIVHGESKAKQALAARLAAIYQDKQQPLRLEIPQ
ncbi:MBL fold metallo-hydrolase RNA specificity domain-containing protein [Stutzerimonas stutzeri]